MECGGRECGGRECGGRECGSQVFSRNGENKQPQWCSDQQNLASWNDKNGDASWTWDATSQKWCESKHDSVSIFDDKPCLRV
jgi:hypothetical protein